MRTPVVLACLALSVVGAALVEACAGGESGTTGKRVVLHTRIASEPAARSAFTNALGWSITLQSAHVATGPLYYFDGEPIFSRLDRLRGVLLPRVAHAHPGHYVAGTARGEMTIASSIDLLAPSNVLADGRGITGPYRSARFSFGSPPAGPHASALGGHVVVVEGRAESGATSLAFRARADVADVLNSFGEPALDGCRFQPVDVAGDGTITVTVLPTVWFDQVDFAGVSGSGVVELSGTTAHNGFTRGLKKGTAYAFAYARD